MSCPFPPRTRAFLQRILLGLRTGGESAIIVPDSFLARTDPDAIRVRPSAGPIQDPEQILEEIQKLGAFDQDNLIVPFALI